MYISLNWINEYVDLEGISLKEIEKKFTLATAEIEGIEEKGKNIQNVVVGKVLSVEEKPELKSTRVVRVDVGNGEVLQSCCGASNVREGMIVACAKPGGSINGIPVVAARKTGGYDSNCVLCSERELGISDRHEGLMELPGYLQVGSDIKEHYDIDDVLIEIDNKSLTNRPDLWGHYGIAREFAAIFKRPLKPLDLKEIENTAENENIDITIEDEHCKRYSSLIIKNVTAKETKMTMKIRLFYCGMRSISLLVDLTNYVMLEIGQPMHAFDKRVMDKVVVKASTDNLKFTTLDGVLRAIPDGTMMICNGSEPVGIAGIMGGQASEIKDDTTELLIESACFDAGNIRKSAVKLKHRTDASSRYEKSLDPELTIVGIKRFAKLLSLVQDDIIIGSNLTDVYPKANETIQIEISKKYICDAIGVELTDEYIVDSLTSLEFKVQKQGENYIITVPTFRATKDISIKADIVEEVSRIYGYDNIIPKALALPIEPVDFNEEKDTIDAMKDILTNKYNGNEIHSYVWYDNEFCKEIGIDPVSELKIINSEDGYSARLRNTMIPTMLKAASINAKNYDKFMCYDIGSVFKLDENRKSDEHKKLAIVLFNKGKDKKELFYEAKSIVSNMIRIMKNEEITCTRLDEKIDYADDSIRANFNLSGKVIGKIIAVKDQVAKKIANKAKIIVCEIDLDAVVKSTAKKIVYKAPSIYQETRLDFNFIADEKTYLDDIYKHMNAYKSDIKAGVTLVDVYKGIGIPEGKMSMTYNVLLVSGDRTLTSEEITSFQEGFINHMTQIGLSLR